MTRLIAHLIRDEAKQAHEAITYELARRFGVRAIADRIVPHLTLKRWFELDREGMRQLHAVLDAYALTHAPSPYRLHGFGHFDTSVIFMHVDPSTKTTQNIRELTMALHTVPQLTFDAFDEREVKLHATVAMDGFPYEEVWSYLHTIPTDFQMSFDNIAVLARTETRWEVERIWELRAERLDPRDPQ